MIFPITSEVLVQIYQCPLCSGIYQAQTGNIRSACLVAHAPGSCCHYGELQISNETLEKVLEVMAQSNKGLHPTTEGGGYAGQNSESSDG